MNGIKVLVVGSGYMAFEYAKVLSGLKICFSVVGRSIESCNKFRSAFPEIDVFSGGIEDFKQIKSFNHCIIATNVDFLMSHTLLMLENDIDNILVEKPGGKNIVEIDNIYRISKEKKSKVFIAYNRRFYTSVQRCLELIKMDSKILSFNFEFTELPHTLENMPNQEVVKENLLYANSSHLIDLAFFFNGLPKKMFSIAHDELKWHKKAIFSGIGIAQNDAIFSYQANWKAPGRWGLEINTENNRYVFRPLEELWIQKAKSMKLEKYLIEDDIDLKYKPGLFNQVYSFLFNQKDPRLLNFKNHFENCTNIYEIILKGNVDIEM